MDHNKKKTVECGYCVIR